VGKAKLKRNKMDNNNWYKGKIIAISISKRKGTKKHNIKKAELKKNIGIVGDAHAGSTRPISLLAEESIEKILKKGLKVGPGDFAENITTRGIDLLKLRIGQEVKLGERVIIEIVQIGKICHSKCNIYYQAGDCVMPREGIFAQVLRSGTIKGGDAIVIEPLVRKRRKQCTK
jgi:MOSC domain-containing protein YiiM